MKNKSLSFLLIILFSFNLKASLLKLETIFNKVTAYHGKAYYKVNRSLLIQEVDKTYYKVKETWYIKDGKNMFLSFYSPENPAFKGAILYKNNYKYFLNTDKKIEKKKLKASFFETYFFAKNPTLLRQKLFQNKIIPPRLHKAVERFYEKPFIRFSRKLGKINYQIGDKSDQAPGLWVEQDNFFIKFLKLNNGVKIEAHDYKNLGSLFFPKLLKVKSETGDVIIQNERISYLKKSSSYFKTRHLYTKKTPLNIESLSDQAKEFYQNFR